MRIAAVVVALGGVVFAFVWPGTCRTLHPLGPYLPSQASTHPLLTVCDAHVPLRIGIAVAGIVVGLILAAVASRREAVSA